MLALSGQVGADPATGRLASGAGAQTARALANLTAVLDAAGASWDHVLMVRVHLTTVDDLAAMNEAYARMVPTPRPARTTVFVTLPAGMLVEIDALAVAP
jgi:2-iminobutanoate/2-iminopropanoate deaminase